MASPPRNSSVYRFGRYELAAADAELRRDGAVVPLAPKPAQLLLLLIHNRDRIVSREEILASLWPRIRVSDAAFNSVVRDLRRALGDEGRAPQIVATARGRGLRFLGSIQLRVTDMRQLAPPEDRYVGREQILASLRSRFDAARAGVGGVVLLGGQAGVGKTRTARELAGYAHQVGAAVHYGRCWRPGFAPPYRPWVELLESMAEHIGPAERSELMGPKLSHLARLVPSFRVAPDAGEAVDAQEQVARFEVFDAVTAWLQRISQSVPILLVIDDLEDADDSTLGLLEFVASHLDASRVLLLANYRTPALDPQHPLFATLARLARLERFGQLMLTGFDRDETRRFVAALAAQPFGEDEIQALHARTDGNPLLLSLLVRSLPSAGASDLGESVPATVRDWIRGRLLSLPQTCVECLQAAATIGRGFEDAVVSEMLGRDPAAVQEVLAVARRASLLAEPGPPFYRFTHTLLQEAIYEDIPLALRTELHRRAGEALQRREPRGLSAAVAHHLTLAVDLVGERAVEAAERAADHAEHQLAFEEAVRLRDRALDALRAIRRPETLRHCDLLIGRGRALLAARRVAEAWETARESAALARGVGSAEHIARAALLLSDFVLADSTESVALLEEALRELPAEQGELRAQVACGLSQMLWYHGQSDRRRKLAQEARSAARAIGGERLEIASLLAERHALHAPEHLSDRIRLASEAIALAEPVGFEALRCLAISWRAVDLLECGDVIGAELDVDAVERVVASERAPRFRAFPMRWRALRAILAGRFGAAERSIGEGRELMLRAGDPNAEAYAGIQAGLMMLEQGRGAEVAGMLSSAPWVFTYRARIPSMAGALALIEIEAGSAGPARRLLEDSRAGDWARLREDPELLGTVSWLAEICARLEESDFAATLAERLSPYGDRICGFYAVACRGSFARYLGLLERAAGRALAAEHWFEVAVAANRAIDAGVYAAWSQWEWAETLVLGGASRDLSRARALAAEAGRSARELGLGRLVKAMRRSPAGRLLGEHA